MEVINIDSLEVFMLEGKQKKALSLYLARLGYFTEIFQEQESPHRYVVEIKEISLHREHPVITSARHVNLNEAIEKSLISFKSIKNL